MAKPRNEQTSKRVASIAGKLLASDSTRKPVKRVAASALTQTRNRPIKSRRK